MKGGISSIDASMEPKNVYIKYYGPNLLTDTQEEFMAWGWKDIQSQRALAATERHQLRSYVEEAERLFDFDRLEQGEIVGRVSITPEEVGPVEWAQRVEKAVSSP